MQCSERCQASYFHLFEAEEFNNCLIHWPDSRLQLLHIRPDSLRLAGGWFSFSNLFYWELKAWIYVSDCAQVQEPVQHPPHQQHTALCQTIHMKRRWHVPPQRFTSWYEAKLFFDHHSSCISLEAAAPSTASKPKTQVIVVILQRMGETSAEVRANRTTTISKHW